jgi:hypothetical protein
MSMTGPALGVRHLLVHQHERVVAGDQHVARRVPEGVIAALAEVELADQAAGGGVDDPQPAGGDGDDAPAVGLHQVRFVHTGLVGVGARVVGSLPRCRRRRGGAAAESPWAAPGAAFSALVAAEGIGSASPREP